MRLTSKVILNNSSVNLVHKFYGSINNAKRLVLVIPNCYGHLKYINTLCQLLADKKCFVVLLSFRGQSNSTGFLNLEGASEDFCLSYSFASSIASNHNIPLVVLNHCTGFYPMLLAAPNLDYFNDLSLFILYSYLARPAQFIAKAETRMAKYNVAYDAQWFNGHELASSYVPKLGCKSFVVHPTIRTSLARANRKDVEELCGQIPEADCVMPAYGYEILDFNQFDSVSKIILNHYLSRLPT